ncbi:hypothetical protein [Novosphingobium sp.]|uniref:hypothetical protein n=1 Tax=Novosphingobium sp. TaxID=1874826 RepID=UPI00286B0AE2|nr:hypothetical protein [Novosphingobium sp.]
MSSEDDSLYALFFPFLWRGMAIAVGLIALISPIIYMGMARRIDWAIVARIILLDSAPVWGFVAISVWLARRLFASKQTLPAFAALLLAFPVAVWWAWMRLS